MTHLDTLVRKSFLCVALESTCVREKLLAGMLCFLHHIHNNLGGKHEPSLPDTSCQSSYLNTEESISWFQTLVKEAYEVLLQSHHC